MRERRRRTRRELRELVRQQASRTCELVAVELEVVQLHEVTDALRDSTCIPPNKRRRGSAPMACVSSVGERAESYANWFGGRRQRTDQATLPEGERSDEVIVARHTNPIAAWVGSRGPLARRARPGASAGRIVQIQERCLLGRRRRAQGALRICGATSGHRNAQGRHEPRAHVGTHPAPRRRRRRWWRRWPASA